MKNKRNTKNRKERNFRVFKREKIRIDKFLCSN